MEAEFKKIDVNGGGIILFDEHLGRLSYCILLAFDIFLPRFNTLSHVSVRRSLQCPTGCLLSKDAKCTLFDLWQLF